MKVITLITGSHTHTHIPNPSPEPEKNVDVLRCGSTTLICDNERRVNNYSEVLFTKGNLMWNIKY